MTHSKGDPSITRKLLLLSLANLAIACALFALYPQFSEIRSLAAAVRGLTDTDSSRFLEQAWQTVHSGHPLYRTLFFEQHVKFIYPTSSLVIYPIAHLFGLELNTFIKLLNLASVALTLLLSGDLCARVSGIPATDHKRRLHIHLLVASLGILFYPIVYGAYIGQIQTFLTFLWTLAVWLWLTERKAAAAVGIALICSFKPPLALFLVWAALRRQWRFLLWFAAAAVLIQAIAIYLYGWRNELDYLAVLSYISQRGEALLANQTVNGLLERWTHNGDPTVWSDTAYPPVNRLVHTGTLLSTAILLLIAFAVPMLLRWKDTLTDFILFGLVSTIASPIAWQHHYGLFFVGCVYFIALSYRQSQRIPPLFAACFLVLANAWVVVDHLSGKIWSPLLSYDLYAGLGILLFFLFALDHTLPLQNDPPKAVHFL